MLYLATVTRNGKSVSGIGLFQAMEKYWKMYGRFEGKFKVIYKPYKLIKNNKA